MSIITIAHVTTSLKRGGAEEVLCSLVEHLDPTLFASHVIYFHEGPQVERLRQFGVPLYHIHGLFFTYDPLFWYLLVRTLLIIKPDCIHTLLWSSQIACRVIGYLLCVPVITVYHNQITLLHGIRALLDRYTVAYATHIVAVSTTVAQSLRTQYSFIPAAHIKTIANGVNTVALTAHQNRHRVSKASLHIPDTARIIGTVGRLHPVKKHALLLEAYALLCKQHPHTYLVLVGDGTELSRLRDMVHHMQLDTTVIFITNAQAYGYYHLFDCFVLPSEQEGMSMALLEAQFYQRACIIAHEGTHDSITHGFNGLIVQPNNADALAAAIIKILTDVSLKDRLAQEAHSTVVTKFGIQDMVKQYEHLFMQKQ